MAEDNRRLKTMVRREVREVMRQAPSDGDSVEERPGRVKRGEVGKRDDGTGRRRTAGQARTDGPRAKIDREIATALVDQASGNSRRRTTEPRKDEHEDGGSRRQSEQDGSRPSQSGQGTRRSSASGSGRGRSSQSGASAGAQSTLTVEQVRHLIQTELQRSQQAGTTGRSKTGQGASSHGQDSEKSSGSSSSAGSSSESAAGQLGSSSAPISQLSAQQLQTLIQQELQSERSPSAQQKTSQKSQNAAPSTLMEAPSPETDDGKNSQAVAVAEVLTQAQWELSKELEANLKQLRQVINQSQEVARKIEQVLGRGQKGQSSGSN